MDQVRSELRCLLHYHYDEIEALLVMVIDSKLVESSAKARDLIEGADAEIGCPMMTIDRMLQDESLKIEGFHAH